MVINYLLTRMIRQVVVIFEGKFTFSPHKLGEDLRFFSFFFSDWWLKKVCDVHMSPFLGWVCFTSPF